jgi:hypothetical protein
MKKIILGAMMLAGIGAVGAKAGEDRRVQPDYRIDRASVRYYEGRRDGDFLAAKRQLHNDMCRERAALANAAAIQLSCGANPQDVAVQNLVLNQQLAAHYGAKQCELNTAYGAHYIAIAPVCR